MPGLPPCLIIMGKKRKHVEEEEEEGPGESSHRQATPAHLRAQETRLIVVLERANLETVKVRRRVFSGFGSF